MTKSRGIAFVLVLALTAGIQHYGLERQEETKAEAPMKKVAGLPASQVLPTYIASLFFGAFRAVAVDILWIQLRKVEEEKRWYERREIVQLISYVQPRNPEVWSHLGWHSAYNVANGFTDPEKSWEWVKFGLGWLRKGIRILPNEPYLKDQLAYTLWHKPSWRDGILDLDLLRRIEGDAELQATLAPDGVKAEHPQSAFELAIPWLERGRDELMTRDFELTQMGLYLYPDSLDGFVRLCMVLQGMYSWKLGKRDQAKDWFRRAQRQCEEMVQKSSDSTSTGPKYHNALSSIFADWAKMYARYPELVDLEARATASQKREDNLALLKTMQELLATYGPIDELWFWNRYNQRSLLNELKIRLTQGEDLQECNDSFEMASDVNPGDLLRADLAPEGLDVDYYWLKVLPPPTEGKDQAAPARPAQPVPVTMKFGRPPTPTLDLKVTVYDPNRHPLTTAVITKGGEIRIAATEWGRYFVKVEGAIAPPWPPDTRYSFQYLVGK